MLKCSNQSCSSSVGREPLEQWAQGDDDHDGCDDEFSSCGQLEQSAGRKRDFTEEERKDGN